MLYLLDTNHLSAALHNDQDVREKIRDLRRRGERIGTCLPVLCELQVGIALTAHREHNLGLLRTTAAGEVGLSPRSIPCWRLSQREWGPQSSPPTATFKPSRR